MSVLTRIFKKDTSISAEKFKLKSKEILGITFHFHHIHWYLFLSHAEYFKVGHYSL